MFGFISKKKLAKELKYLTGNNPCNKSTGESGEDRIRDFYWRCGNANAVNYLRHKFGVKLKKEEPNGVD